MATAAKTRPDEPHTFYVYVLATGETGRVKFASGLTVRDTLSIYRGNGLIQASRLYCVATFSKTGVVHPLRMGDVVADVIADTNTITFSVIGEPEPDALIPIGTRKLVWDACERIIYKKGGCSRFVRSLSKPFSYIHADGDMVRLIMQASAIIDAVPEFATKQLSMEALDQLGSDKTITNVELCLFLKHHFCTFCMNPLHADAVAAFDAAAYPPARP
jgi:hypothetical protein